MDRMTEDKHMKKNILIIGGSYFAGRVLVEILSRENDYSVYVLNRGNVPLNMDCVDEIVCDRHDINLKKSIPELTFDAVIDFCAYTPLDIIQLMLAFPEGSVKHFIFISTVSIYEDTHDLPVKEDAPKLTGIQKHLGQAADYGYNKWLAELKLAELCEKSNIPFTSLRPSIIYGKYNYAPRESYFFDLIDQGKPVILPENRLALFQFISVWDVANIIITCLGKELVFNQAFNLTGPELISYRRLVEILEIISGNMIPYQTMSTSEIDRQRIPLPFPLDSHLIYSGTHIQKILDFNYTPFEQGMKKTYEHYMKMTTSQALI